ncbi:hypothetical protein [Pseudoalteromonas rubra]|uniref:hypothetical protein n=1 Tax=Pseudoalteromonas rubra TaxID=43658 RepID=UPI0012DD33D4|nr:hypothetical protein [Pseudoalteromonas rubra]
MKTIKFAAIFLCFYPFSSIACFDGSAYERSFAHADPYAIAALILVTVASFVRLCRTRNKAYILVVTIALIVGSLVYTRTAYNGDCGDSYVSTADHCLIFATIVLFYEFVRACVVFSKSHRAK